MKSEIQDEKLEKENESKESEKEKPLDKMTAPELRELAKTIPGISGVHAMKKDQLIKMIREAKGIKEEELVKKKKRPVQKKEYSVKELKQKIALLKQEKISARAGKKRKSVDILSRRINRLKKRTRKVAAQA